MDKIIKKIGLIGKSAAFEQILRTVEQVAPTDISALIFGESGTGKELVAQALHEASRRRNGPFVVVNAGAIPEGIIESELFGHEKGAFTGAISMRRGFFETADGGTIFLDEIGEMPLDAQVRLLRVLEAKEIIRVGSGAPRKVNVRVVAATNKDLLKMVGEKRFREDLYYRLNVIRLKMPPLRERREDIPLLATHFAKHFCEQNNFSFAGFSDSAIEALIGFHWPGNIRELKNTVESLIVIGGGGVVDARAVQRQLPAREVNMGRNLPVPLDRPHDELERELIYRFLLEIKNELALLKEALLGGYVSPNRRIPAHVPVEASGFELGGSEIRSFEEPPPEEPFPTMEEMEKELLYRALDKSGGNKRKAANMLAISERTLYRKIKEFNLPF